MGAQPLTRTLHQARDEAEVLGWLIQPDGREQPIDRRMIELALHQLEVRQLSLHGRHEPER